MRLTRVVCRNFRSLAAVDFAPVPGVNVVCGRNAQGKTSLLEAVVYAATTRSHRTQTDTELARHGEEEFHVRLEAGAETAAAPVVVEANWWRGAKRFKVNGIPQGRLSDLLGRVKVVLFCPDDLALVKGAASVRRKLLDMELSQLSPPYLFALQQYRQALRQRNELLRRGEPEGALLDVWDVQLITHGRALMEARAAYIAELSELAAEMYRRIAEAEPLAAAYLPDVRTPDELAQTLARGRASDVRQRLTGRGPHRDDLELLVAGRPARTYGSQGQQRSAVLALKLAEVELVRRRAGTLPTLMLDEVLAELDADRARSLFAAIPEGTQSLVTTTQTAEPLRGMGVDFAVFRMEGGCLGQE